MKDLRDLSSAPAPRAPSKTQPAFLKTSSKRGTRASGSGTTAYRVAKRVTADESSAPRGKPGAARAPLSVEQKRVTADGKSSVPLGKSGAARAPLSVEEIREIFGRFDADGSGSIGACELEAAMHRLGKRVSESRLAQMIADADTNGDGAIDFDEFVEIMRAAEGGDVALSSWAVLGAYPEGVDCVFGGLPVKTLAEWLATPSGRGGFRDGSVARLRTGVKPAASSSLSQRWDAASSMAQSMAAAKHDVAVRHELHRAIAAGHADRCQAGAAQRALRHEAVLDACNREHMARRRRIERMEPAGNFSGITSSVTSSATRRTRSLSRAVAVVNHANHSNHGANDANDDAAAGRVPAAGAEAAALGSISKASKGSKESKGSKGEEVSRCRSAPSIPSIPSSLAAAPTAPGHSAATPNRKAWVGSPSTPYDTMSFSSPANQLIDVQQRIPALADSLAARYEAAKLAKRDISFDDIGELMRIDNGLRYRRYVQAEPRQLLSSPVEGRRPSGGGIMHHLPVDATVLRLVALDGDGDGDGDGAEGGGGGVKGHVGAQTVSSGGGIGGVGGGGGGGGRRARSGRPE